MAIFWMAGEFAFFEVFFICSFNKNMGVVAERGRYSDPKCVRIFWSVGSYFIDAGG